MARLSKTQLEQIKKKYGVDTIYSFSKYNSYLTDSYGYMLKYIKRMPANVKESIYGLQGNGCHEIIQDFMESNIKYDDMIDKYEELLFQLDSDGYKYSKNDKDMNENISKKYENSIRHFFMNYKPLPYKWLIEKPIIINVRGFIFQGYIDAITKLEDGTYLIQDEKTSSIYTGEKKLKESAQLFLYALGISQKFNISFDQIKCRWNFLKYTTVTSDLKGKNKDGSYKTKSKNCLRCEWVKESKGNIKKWIEAEGYDELEVEDILQSCIEKNSLDDYPEIAKHFTLNDCYVYIDLTEENVNTLCDKVEKTLKEIEEKTNATKEYLELIKNTEDKEEIKYFEKLIDDMWWCEISQKDMYYYYNLCSYDRKLHKPLNEYLLDSEMFMKKDDKVTVNKSNNDDLDFDWD